MVAAHGDTGIAFRAIRVTEKWSLCSAKRFVLRARHRRMKKGRMVRAGGPGREPVRRWRVGGVGGPFFEI